MFSVRVSSCFATESSFVYASETSAFVNLEPERQPSFVLLVSLWLLSAFGCALPIFALIIVSRAFPMVG